MMSDYAIDKQNEKNEELDFKYRERRLNPLIIHAEIETIPVGTAQRIINTVVWGNPEGKSKYER